MSTEVKTLKQVCEDISKVKPIESLPAIEPLQEQQDSGWKTQYIPFKGTQSNKGDYTLIHPLANHPNTYKLLHKGKLLSNHALYLDGIDAAEKHAKGVKQK